MKISFLIPSKNRLALLKHAVSSILAQNYTDFEIVISDNASEDDYKAYVDTLHGWNVVYRRTETTVPVTENWQRALALSTGDYVLMLGDDDALDPNFIRNVLPFLSPTGPDLIYLSAYHYCYPKVIDAYPNGYLAAVHNSEFLLNAQGAFCLAPAYARELASSVLNLQYRFGLNAQHFLLKSSFVRQFEAQGGFYQSPYPDTFAAIATFTHALDIVVIPTLSVIIGISPKSFGYFYFSNQHEKGYELLDNERVNLEVRQSLLGAILPGDRNNTNWLVAAETARRAVMPAGTPGVNIERYRMLQVLSVLCGRYVDDRLTDSAVAELAAKLDAGERLSFGVIKAVFATARDLDRNVLIRLWQAMQGELAQFAPARVNFVELGPHESIRDAFLWLSDHAEASTAQDALPS